MGTFPLGDDAYVVESAKVSRCAPEDLMNAILDASQWPKWQPEIVMTAADGRVAEGEIVDGRAKMLGFAVDGRSQAERVTDSDFEEDVIVGVRMRIRYEVRPHRDGSEVRVRLATRLPTGFSGRLLSLLLRYRLRRMQKIGIERLVAQAEAESPA
jgi:Polyketide cyclase / dehydrase and lipid transport